tara:strand:- start:480 stop:1097 length:618 start_codon:yes stop_codon:yes gene_type:complete
MVSWATAWNHVLETHGFVHIPKTGGTSIESKLTNETAIILRQHPGPKPRASPWHLPVDEYEATYAPLKYKRPTFCVVREPRDRLRSCMAWPYSSRFRTPFDELARTFAGGRRGVRWSEEYVHRAPQSWFVWNEDGSVACDCVIAYPKLDAVFSTVHKNRGARADPKLRESSFPRQLYAMDALLYGAALRADGLCYAPAPLYAPSE